MKSASIKQAYISQTLLSMLQGIRDYMWQWHFITAIATIFQAPGQLQACTKMKEVLLLRTGIQSVFTYSGTARQPMACCLSLCTTMPDDAQAQSLS